MFLVRAGGSVEPDESLVEEHEDFVVYAVSGEAREIYWLAPFPELTLLNPVPSESLQVLVEETGDWGFDPEVAIAAPKKLLRHGAFLERIMDGDPTVVREFEDIRFGLGDPRSDLGMRRIQGWVDAIREERSPRPSDSALLLAMRLGWLSASTTSGLRPVVEVPAARLRSPEEQIEARQYWAREFNHLVRVE